jgi:hypothetical protein
LESPLSVDGQSGVQGIDACSWCSQGVKGLEWQGYHVNRVNIAWFKDLGPSKDNAYTLSTVANITSAQLDMATRRALALSQLCSPPATPWVSGGFEFSQHSNLMRASTLHNSTKTRELLYSRLLLHSLEGLRHHDRR